MPQDNLISVESSSSLMVLIIEDDKGLSRLIQKTLMKEGFKSEMVFTGQEAVARGEDRDTLLLMDYFLPDMTGKDVIKNLTDKNCYVPFIIMTGLGNEEIAVEMMKMGAKDYLVKGPGFMDMLPHVIRQVAKELEWEKELSSAQDALQDSEIKFRTLFNQASDAIFLLSPQKDSLKIEDVNLAALTMHGYTADELIGKPIAFLDDTDARKRLPGRLKRILAGKPVNFEAAHVRKDGSTFPVEVSAQLIHIGDNPYVLAIDRDISRRKLAETELLRKQSELSALYSISSSLGQTLNLNELFSIIFKTIKKLDLFKLKKMGAIFFVEDQRMKLVYQLGHCKDFVKKHEKMSVGDCLCGLAAQTGEIIISENSISDSRHTIIYEGISPHSHIIIPLIARNKVIGVLCLNLEVGSEIDEYKMILVRSIGNQIGIAMDNSMLFERTKISSLHDPLTGLANRRFLDIILEKSFENAKRFKRPFSIILIDIDHFKDFNDTHGHVEGDKLLIKLAGVLIKETRAIDFVVRYGGEEFLILLNEVELSKAFEIAEAKRKAVKARTAVTVSLGVTSYHAGIQNIQELINKADNALYKAKQKGKDQTEASV
jgi:diguanylate cyclase (GGDEF)-like protein/PAS domain S-box-containing protein